MTTYVIMWPHHVTTCDHVTTSCDHSVIALDRDYCSWEMNSLLRWTISLTCRKLGAIHQWSELYLHLSLPLIGHQDLPIHGWAGTDPRPSPMHGSSSPHCRGTEGEDCIGSKEGILNNPWSSLLLIVLARSLPPPIWWLPLHNHFTLEVIK